MSDSKWLASISKAPHATFRLVCFPHAGGGALPFYRLAKLMPGWVEVLAVVPPGRESRFREPFASGIPEIASATASALRELPPLPHAFYGHSMGAIVAFECAHLLHGDEIHRARHLFLSGRRAYGPVPFESMLAHLPRQDFIREISIRYGGIPRQVLEDEDMLNLFLPIIRSDIAALERHTFPPRPPLDLPMTLLGGQDDPQCSEAEWAGWSSCFTGEVRQIRFPGDHFYMLAQSESLAGALLAGIASPPLP